MYRNVATQMSPDRNGQTEVFRDRNGLAETARPNRPVRVDQTEKSRTDRIVPFQALIKPVYVRSFRVLCIFLL